MLLSNQVGDRSPKFGSIGRRKPEAFAIAAEQHRKARMRQMGKSRSEFFRGLSQSLQRHPVYGAERRDYVWRAESVVSRRSDEIKPMSRYFRVLNMDGEGARKLLEGSRQSQQQPAPDLLPPNSQQSQPSVCKLFAQCRWGK